MKKLLLASCIAFAFSTPAYSALSLQDEIDPEEEFGDEFDDEFGDFYGGGAFVSIATGTKKRIDKAPSVASIITSDMIERMGAQDIDDVLETVPGLHVNRSSNGNEPLYTFRGVYSRFNPQVLMLVNGFPITNIFVGNRNQIWGGMPVQAISRIEVIRGPGSAVYGADAFSGVINIITKSFEDTKASEVGASFGNFDTTNFWLTARGQLNNINTLFSYEYFETDGYDGFIESDAQSFLDGIFGTDASFAPGNMGNGRENHEMRLQLDWSDFTLRAGLQKRIREPGIGITDALAPITTSSSDRYNLDLTYSKQISEESSFKAEFSYFDTSQEIDGDLQLFPPGSDIGLGGPFPDGVIGTPEVFERHKRVYITYSYAGLKDHDLRFGAGYTHNDVYKVQETKNFALGPNGEFLAPGSPVVDVSDTPYAFLPEKDRESYYLFAQDIWQIANDWELTAGIRHDNYSDFGSTTNPRLALVWSTSLRLTTKILYGNAFRAPSFANLFNINNPAALGNPDLSPETMETFELSFNYHLDDINLTASVFNYTWGDIIEFVQGEGSTVSIAQNTGENDGFGYELEALWKISETVDLRANYAYQKAESEATGLDVPYAPGNQLFAELNIAATSNININLNLTNVADRKREVLDPRHDIDDYTKVNASLNWKPDLGNYSVHLHARNIFDEDIREPTRNSGGAVNVPNDMPLAGRDFAISIKYHFE